MPSVPVTVIVPAPSCVSLFVPASIFTAVTLPAKDASVPSVSVSVAVMVPSVFSVMVPESAVPVFNLTFVPETEPAISKPVAEPSVTSSSAVISPLIVTRPAAVPLTDLPCRYLPEAMDIFLYVTMASLPGFGWIVQLIAPSALTDSLITIAPSVWMSRLPSTVTAPAVPFSLNSTPTSSNVSEKSSRLISTLPPFTSSIVTLPPRYAPRVVFPANAAPLSIVTLRPAIAMRSAANAAPDATSTFPPIVKDGASLDAFPLIAPLMATAFSRVPATALKSPPTFTCAPAPNAMPLGLTTQTLPPLFPLMIPSICDFPAVGATRLKRVDPDWLKRKFARSPCTRLNCDQSNTPPFDNCWIVVTPVAVPAPVVFIVPNSPVCPVTCATSSASTCSGP